MARDLRPGLGAQTTRADVAATKRVTPSLRKQQIRSHVNSYADNSRRHARALRALGVPADAIRVIHRAKTSGARTSPGVRTGRSFTGGRSLTPRETLATSAPNSRDAMAAARDWAGQPVHTKPTRLDRLAKNAVDYGTGIPTVIGLIRHGHNSVDLQRTANVKDATNLAAGLAFGGPHVPDLPKVPRSPKRASPRVAKPYAARTIQLNDLRQQLPKSRSRITRNVIEKPADKASLRLQKSERATKTRAVRLLTAGERIAKAAGRGQRQEMLRRDAAMSQHLRTIAKVKPGTPEDVANFWYAQLPKTHRNAEGLKLVQAKQKEELAHISSGKALENLNAAEAGVRAKMGAAKTAEEKFRLLKKAEDLRKLKTDLPNRVGDVSASIASLDKLIARPPASNEAAIAAVHHLSSDSKRIYIEAQRLKPDVAAARQGLVSRWVGLNPTGEEAFIGHRLPNPESFRGSNMPSGGVGRVRSPKGLGQENKLILAKTGRLRASLRVAAEDWRSSQMFHGANVDRNTLSKMGAPYGNFVPQGHVLVNPKGRTIPANWKTDELAQFGLDNHADIQALRDKAKQIVDGFVAADPSAHERMKQEATAAGVHWNELRVVPKRHVDRYYSQFKASSGRKTPAKVYDGMVDAVVTSIVFARIGYIPKNLVQNIIMAAPHQGPMLLVNATRAAQALADKQLRPLLHAEVGFGQNVALGKEAISRKLVGATAGFVGKIADDPLRFSAFMHEAAAEGVISRVNPLLTEKDRAALLNLLTNPAERPRLNDIRQRASDAMVDFSRLTPDQARIARRFLVIPSWLMSGSRYPFHFAITHPIRSALLAYIAMGEPGAPDRLQFNKPLDKYFTKGLPPFLTGVKMSDGKVLRTGSLDPVTTPLDIGQAVVQTARGKKNPFDFAHQTAFDFAQPLASTAIDFASGGGLKSFERLVPNEKLVRGLISPKASKSYPDDATRLGRLKREVGVLPIHVSADTPHEHQIARYKTFRQDLEQVLKATGVAGISPKVEGRLRLRVDRALARTAAKDPLVADVELMQSHGWISPEKAASAKQWLATATPEQRGNFSRYLTEHYFDPDALLSGGVNYFRKQGHKIKLPAMPSSKRK